MCASTLKEPKPGTGSGTKRWLWIAPLLVILALAAYLRLDGLGEPSLWLDEILHFEKAHKAMEEPWHAWLTGVSVDRENGSLYYAGQVLALSLFEGEFAVRLMPALAGIATVAIIFLVGLSATGSRRMAMVGAALLAVSPLHVYYSREGRPYSAVMLLAALLLLLALERRRPWTKTAAYVLCIATTYLGAVGAPMLLSCALLAAVDWFRHRRSGHLLVAASSALAIGVLLFPTAERLGGVVGALNRTVRWDIIKPLSRVAFDRLLASLSVSGVDRGSSNLLSFLFLALAIWGGITLARRKAASAYWTAGMCLVPIAGSLAALVAFDHWYNVRYTSGGLPAFLVLVAIGLVDLWERGWRRARQRTLKRRLSWLPDSLLAALLVLLLAPAWRAARAEPQEKPDWRGVAELIGRLASPDEPVIARGRWATTCIRHYLRRLDLPIEVLSCNYDPALAKKWTDLHPRAWVLSAGYRQAPEFKAWTRDLHPVLRQRLANLELFFFPNFETFLSEPRRIEFLKSAAAQRGESATRQEFEHSELWLGSGWSYPERAPDGMTFRWATAARAEIALLAPPETGAQALRLRLLPFPSPDRPPQVVEITVGSHPPRRITLEAGWTEVTLAPMAGEPAAGLVTFDFDWLQSPKDLDDASQDPRTLAVAFDFVEAINLPPSEQE